MTAIRRRIMGLETEYGIANMQDSSRRLGPDEIARTLFAPVVEEHRSSNIYTENASRLYLDVGAHPEFATAECDSLHQLIAYDRSGDLMFHELADRAEQAVGGKVYLLKNNTDSLGNSYGCHENYLVSRDVPLKGLSKQLLPFLVTRQLICGAGKLAIPYPGAPNENFGPGYTMSQRADHVWEGVSSATTRSRPIINTRDEPHADADRFGRLHVIIGDANQSQTSNLLKFGMTALVLDAIESGVDFSDLQLTAPVEELERVSRDVTLQHRLQLADGRELSALEVLAEYRQRVTATTEVDRKVLAAWDEAVALLAEDPLSAAHLLDWVAKYRLVRAYMDRGIAADNPKLAAIDLQYADVDPDKSLYYALLRKGQMRELVSGDELAAAADTPPDSSRAYLRGRVLEKFGDAVAAASWDTIVLHAHINGLDKQAVLRLKEVGSATATHVGQAVDEAGDVPELLEALARAGITAEYR